VHSLVVTCAGGLVAYSLMHVFYYAVRTEWPTNYVSIHRDYGVIVNRSWLRYLIFRTVPPYLISLLVGTTCSRLGGHGLLCAVIAGVVHATKNNALHFVRTLHAGAAPAKPAILLVDLSTFVMVLLGCFLGGLGPGRFRVVVPGVDKFFESLWTTSIVAIFGAGLLHLSKKRTTTDRLIGRSKHEVGDLLTYAQDAAMTGRGGPPPREIDTANRESVASVLGPQIGAHQGRVQSCGLIWCDAGSVFRTHHGCAVNRHGRRLPSARRIRWADRWWVVRLPAARGGPAPLQR
jgi:hypothetical protein